MFRLLQGAEVPVRTQEHNSCPLRFKISDERPACLYDIRHVLPGTGLKRTGEVLSFPHPGNVLLDYLDCFCQEVLSSVTLPANRFSRFMRRGQAQAQTSLIRQAVEFAKPSFRRDISARSETDITKHAPQRIAFAGIRLTRYKQHSLKIVRRQQISSPAAPSLSLSAGSIFVVLMPVKTLRNSRRPVRSS
jgi:hypothetical protein